MKKLQRVLCIVMVVLFAAQIFTSCSKGESDDVNITNTSKNDQTTLEKNNNDFDDDLGEFNFNGYEFTIYEWVNDDWIDSRLDYEEITADVYRDSVYMRNRYLEDRFNIEIKSVSFTDPTTMGILIASGATDYDLYVTRNPEMLDYACEGFVNPISDLVHINLDKAYWDSFMTEQLTITNKKFFAVGAFDFTSLDFAYVMIVNKLLLQDYGIENPFELVKNGKWTMDKFAEMCKVGTVDLDGDQMMKEKDAWGFVARGNDVLPAFWIGAGVHAAEKDGDDIPQNTMGTERFINVVDKIFDITWRNESYYDTFPLTMFLEGNVLFNDCTFYRLKNLRAMEVDFSILPYPKFDETQEKYYSRVPNLSLFATPRIDSTENLARTSVILEAMACESLRTCVPAYYNLVLKTKLARDVDSEEIIDYTTANRVVDFVDSFMTIELRDTELRNMFISKNNTLVSLNESTMAGIFDTRRDKIVKAFSELDN